MGGCRSRINETDQITTSSEDNYLSVIRQDVIYRLAIDSSGFIGHLYNAREDCFVTIPTLKSRPISVTSIKESIHQPVIEIDKIEDQHLMKLVGINDKELSLSIHLNLVPHTGICLLLKYPFVINQYTRYLSYYSRTQRTILNGEYKSKSSTLAQQLISEANVTHLVTGIDSGIHVIVILQCSPEYQSQLDHLLNKIKDQSLVNNYQLEEHEEDLLTHITKTNVFSNIPHLGKLTKLSDVWRRITEIECDISHHRPLGYNLKPIHSFFPSYPIDRGNFYSFREEYIHQLDTSLYKLLLARKSLKVSLLCRVRDTLLEHLNGEYVEVQHQIMKIDELYRERMNRIRSVLSEIRCGSLRPTRSNEDMSDHLITSLSEKTCEANDRVDALKVKGQQIIRMKGQSIIYYNVKVLVKSNDEDLKTVEEKLLEKMKNVMFFCFDDKLGENYSSENDKLYQQLIDQIGKSSPSECGYADFTFCKCRLSRPKIIGPRGDFEPSVNFLNVLLLGESGVGKSTFVNALANYLVFDTLEEARAHEPVALMPVSYITTVGDDFKVKLITFGDEDSNEDYKHPGQSVTQHCRSYVFPIDDQTKMRLIDTPGMGDTRGLDQDDRNMEHILSFINHFSHLNAICILLKPNERRLNVVLRSYFTRLVGFLGEHVRDNIVFCFTNTRTTFYAPGNTGPLLKKMLQSHSIKDISFEKTNTFCFDSESFRYLIARMNEIEFSDDDKKDYERSWLISRNESNRLREYISNVLKPYRREKWQSIEHAQFQITQLTRPMLETFRNLCRNFILHQQNPTQRSIELLPKRSSESSSICFTCSFTTQCISQFLVVNDNLHIFIDKCKKCDCSRRDHIDVEYKLEYGNSDPTNEEKVTSMLEELEEMILKLGCFLGNTARTSEEDDPMIRMINLIISQEKEICLSQPDEYLNPQLLEKLKQLKNDYQQRRNNSNRENETIDLERVYQIIESIGTTDSIKKQRDVGEERRKMRIQQQEKELTLNIGPKEN